MKFKTLLNELEHNITQEQKIHTLLILSENIDALNESDEILFEFVNKSLNKVGLKIHKSKGILDYIKAFTTGIGKSFLYIIKGDIDKAKALVKSLKKEDFLDFIFKLDLGTLHLFTGPIHMIDAWTGWDLSVNIKSHMAAAVSLKDSIVSAITKVKHDIPKLFANDTKRQTKMMNTIKRFDKILQVQD